ncbi:hypothetical protein FNF31_00733 [Cafeteria roenbergensis]|uniref:Mucin-like domain-containing protein n=1 Tax=Cafeteria roenbergensis TaxID=33653 RepID=A0A5A8DR83_CAFRO|nr:hypothetical protein FNF31_00733 [Cafeteria roenbergensis]
MLESGAADEEEEVQYSRAPAEVLANRKRIRLKKRSDRTASGVAAAKEALFGAAQSTSDPFKSGGASASDPFKSGGAPASDPFKSGGAPASDPFKSGGASASDPFKSGGAPASDPFKSGGASASDPFKSGGAPASDPFKSGGASASDPFKSGGASASDPFKSGGASASDPFKSGGAPASDPFKSSNGGSASAVPQQTTKLQVSDLGSDAVSPPSATKSALADDAARQLTKQERRRLFASLNKRFAAWVATHGKTADAVAGDWSAMCIDYVNHAADITHGTWRKKTGSAPGRRQVATPGPHASVPAAGHDAAGTAQLSAATNSPDPAPAPAPAPAFAAAPAATSPAPAPTAVPAAASSPAKPSASSAIDGLFSFKPSAQSPALAGSPPAPAASAPASSDPFAAFAVNPATSSAAPAPASSDPFAAFAAKPATSSAAPAPASSDPFAAFAAKPAASSAAPAPASSDPFAAFSASGGAFGAPATSSAPTGGSGAAGIFGGSSTLAPPADAGSAPAPGGGAAEEDKPPPKVDAGAAPRAKLLDDETLEFDAVCKPLRMKPADESGALPKDPWVSLAAGRLCVMKSASGGMRVAHCILLGMDEDNNPVPRTVINGRFLEKPTIRAGGKPIVSALITNQDAKGVTAPARFMLRFKKQEDADKLVSVGASFE